MNYSPAIDALTTSALLGLGLAFVVNAVLDLIFAGKVARMFRLGGKWGGQ